MGFYPPPQLVYDAKRHGVEVRAVDVMHSDWDCTLEPLFGLSQAPVRLGFNLVSGLNQSAAERIVTARAEAPFTSTEDLALRAALKQDDLKALASADALAALSGHRRQQVWDASALKPPPPLFQAVPVEEEGLTLSAASEGEEVVFDYSATGLTLRRHPLAILREPLSRMKLLTAAQMHDLPHGRRVRACGIVTARQQPPTAKGVVFITLEDETGTVNVIVWKRQREKQREQVLKSRLLAVVGVWQRNTEDAAEDQANPAGKHQGEVRHLIAHHLIDLSHLLGELATQSREFH
jgi:error-prone DNA polymerase